MESVREEERFIIQASAFETPCKCGSKVHHALHRHAETTHQPGLILRSKSGIGTRWRYHRRRRALLGLLGEEGDQVVAVLGLLQATEGHLGTGDVLLGVLEVLELERRSATGRRKDKGPLHVCIRSGDSGKTYESVVVPGDALLLVGIGVGEALDLTSLATKKTVKVGTNLL